MKRSRTQGAGKPEPTLTGLRAARALLHLLPSPVGEQEEEQLACELDVVIAWAGALLREVQDITRRQHEIAVLLTTTGKTPHRPAMPQRTLAVAESEPAAETRLQDAVGSDDEDDGPRRLAPPPSPDDAKPRRRPENIGPINPYLNGGGG